jgi:hypothetical protein
VPQVIEAYFDESERNGVFCVAGYCYFPSKAPRAAKKWSEILGGRTFHATDMNCGWGEFKDLDKDTSDRMYRGLVATVLKYAELGIAASVSPNEVTTKWPGLDGFRTAYAVCCHHVVGRVSSYLRDSGIKSRVAYVFEAGHKHAPEADSYMHSIAKSERRRDLYHYCSHAFVSKKDMPLLQTADLLAWEWRKHVLERGFDATKFSLDNMRGSLRELFERGGKKHIVGHFTGSDLDRYFDYIKSQMPSEECHW